jgi:hypothetical protein
MIGFKQIEFMDHTGSRALPEMSLSVGRQVDNTHDKTPLVGKSPNGFLVLLDYSRGR